MTLIDCVKRLLQAPTSDLETYLRDGAREVIIHYTDLDDTSPITFTHQVASIMTGANPREVYSPRPGSAYWELAKKLSTFESECAYQGYGRPREMSLIEGLFNVTARTLPWENVDFSPDEETSYAKQIELLIRMTQGLINAVALENWNTSRLEKPDDFLEQVNEFRRRYSPDLAYLRQLYDEGVKKGMKPLDGEIAWGGCETPKYTFPGCDTGRGIKDVSRYALRILSMVELPEDATDRQKNYALLKAIEEGHIKNRC